MTVKGECASYLKIIPEDASDVQKKETRRAFYAGALAYRNISVKAAGGHSVEIAETILMAAEKELFDYLEEIREGVNHEKSSQ